jgi:hypothetical protein
MIAIHGPEWFSLHGIDATSEPVPSTLDGRQCWKVSAPGTINDYQFWIDPLQGASIVRLRVMHGGVVIFQVDAAYKSMGELWIPEKWLYSSFDGVHGNLEESFEYSVQEVEVNPVLPAALRPDFVDGTVVQDYRSGQVEYADVVSGKIVPRMKRSYLRTIVPILLVMIVTWFIIAKVRSG